MDSRKALNRAEKWQLLLGWEVIKTLMIGLAQEAKSRNNTQNLQSLGTGGSCQLESHSEGSAWRTCRVVTHGNLLMKSFHNWIPSHLTPK